MRILVVEDQSVLRAQVMRALREENYAVDGAVDGEEGLYKIIHGNYDVIVLDLSLPNIDGMDVLRKMRAAGILVPVILLTARDGVGDRVKGLDLGADDYVVKGTDMKEFKARVRVVLRRRSLVPATRIEVGRVCLDLATKQVELAGRTIELTGREYGIVAALMRRLGAVVSRRELYESVIDETDDSMSNLLDVHICNIRKKLGQDFVRTVRGRGYLVERTSDG